MSRRVLAVLAAAAALAALAVVLRRGREPPSDEGQIRELFDRAAVAAEERRIADVVDGLSERFQGSGLDKQGVKRLVAGMVLRGAWVSVTIAGSAISLQGDRAQAVVDVVTARSGKGKALAALLPEEAAAHRITCRLEREPEGWRVVAAEWAPVPLSDAVAGPPTP
jgi:hypothetical protein